MKSYIRFGSLICALAALTLMGTGCTVTRSTSSPAPYNGTAQAGPVADAGPDGQGSPQVENGVPTPACQPAAPAQVTTTYSFNPLAGLNLILGGGGGGCWEGGGYYGGGYRGGYGGYGGGSRPCGSLVRFYSPTCRISGGRRHY